MTAAPDLTNCERELIHIPGKIQSHGFLVAVDTKSGLISYVSENIASFVHAEPASVLGQDLEHLSKSLKLDISGSQVLISQLINTGFNLKSIEPLNPYIIELEGAAYNLIFSTSANNLLIEFEITTNDRPETQKVIGTSISKILAGTSLDSLVQNTAKEIKKIINYDRVMVYRFGDDDHGQVIAEEKQEHLEPFLHLHYPASDIPRQARELYKINLTRIIADVNAEASPILTYQSDAALDLTNSELRAVSPMHIQYLKNMGVQSSFSISLLSKGELWGLIACHNYTPKFIDYGSRATSKLIGQILSSAIEYRQGEENNDKFETLNKASAILIDLIDNASQIPEALTKNETTIKDITEASGAVLIFEQKITCIGQTPGENQIKELAKWLFENMTETVFNTHRFPKVYKPAEKFSGVAGGVLACILSKELKEMLIWFKPEILENIHWAGNPEKPVEVSEDGIMSLSPRKSFESWTETVKHTSLGWSRAEIASVIKLREHVIYAIKRKVNEIRLLNEKLVLAYEELDTFSYTVSHDLRTPLSSIKGYAELLASNENLDINAKKLLQRINKCTDKMASLITEILSYSRIGQSKLNKENVELSKIIDDIKVEMLAAINPLVDITVGNTPAVFGDTIMITQVFSNLIGNEVKYSGKTLKPRVIINGEVFQNEVVYSIADNGIGIDINYYNKVFEIFKRMDNVQDIEGTGVGLAIVKKIIDKHEGRIWFESKLGEGTTFYLAFKNNL